LSCNQLSFLQLSYQFFSWLIIIFFVGFWLSFFTLWFDWRNWVMQILFVLSFALFILFFSIIHISQSVSLLQKVWSWRNILRSFASIWVSVPQSSWIFTDSDGSTNFFPVSLFLETISCGRSRFNTMSVFFDLFL